MRVRTRVLVALTGISAYLALAGNAETRQEGGGGSSEFRPALQLPFKWKGAQGCQRGGTACHSASSGETWNQSYRIFKKKEGSHFVDRHAEAYKVLSTTGDRPENRLSNLMAKRLGIADPQTADVCLNCHASNPKPELRAGIDTSEGVTCESCHGPAEMWNDEHQRRGWKQLSPMAKARMGFLDTSDLYVRAKVCVACHVGSSLNQDVYHDLIAAGHPRLTFELADQVRYYVKIAKAAHWDKEKDLKRNPDLYARLWRVGQVASAQQSLEVTAARASRSIASIGTGKAAPWPEFAESNCFECHHDLAESGWRRQAVRSPRRPGSLSWGTWYLPMTERLAQIDESPLAKASLESIAALRTEMNKTYPRPREVETLAAAAQKQLESWAMEVNQNRQSAADVRKLVKELLSTDAAAVTSSWDHCAQFTFASLAMAYALEDRNAANPKLSEALDAFAQQVGSSEDYSGPNAFDPKRLESALSALKRSVPTDAP